MKCPICGNDLIQQYSTDEYAYIIGCAHGCYEISRDHHNILLTREEYYYLHKHHSSTVTVCWFFLPGGQTTYGYTEVRIEGRDKKPWKTIREQLTIPQIKQWLEKANSLKNLE